MKRLAPVLCVAFFCTACAFSGTYVSEKKAAKIKPGLTTAEVRKILGSPQMDMADPLTGGRKWIYSFAHAFAIPFYADVKMKTFEVSFVDGVVVKPKPLTEAIREARATKPTTKPSKQP